MSRHEITVSQMERAPLASLLRLARYLAVVLPDRPLDQYDVAKLIARFWKRGGRRKLQVEPHGQQETYRDR